MVAFFVRETQDVEKVETNGDAKFNELDRNGLALKMIREIVGAEIGSVLQVPMFLRTESSTTSYRREQDSVALGFSRRGLGGLVCQRWHRGLARELSPATAQSSARRG